MDNKINNKGKDFVVSTADVAFKVNGILAFTGTTSLTSSISVSMEDQEITGGKGNKTLYKYKYGRKLAPSIEMAEWNLAFIAANTGSTITEGLKDVYSIAECVVLTNGVGILSKTPIDNVKVFVEKSDGSIVEVTPVGKTITVGSTNEKVKVTYQYSTNVKRVTIDAESTPLVGELILSADRHNNKLGKVGELQIVIPSFQLNGTFDISLESGGTTTTKLEGDALAVEGETCSEGSVYAHITEIPSKESAISVTDIAATPAEVSLSVGDTKSITVVGIKGGLYSNVGIDIADCVVTSSDASIATVAAGVVTGVAAGTTDINIVYNGIADFIKVTVA